MIKTFEVEYVFIEGTSMWNSFLFNGYPTYDALTNAIAKRFNVHPSYVIVKGATCLEDEYSHFESMLNKPSWWGKEPRTIGQIIYFIYRYSNMTVAEYAQVGSNSVHYAGRPFATYIFDERNIPIFKFVDDTFGSEKKQRIFLKYFKEERK